MNRNMLLLSLIIATIAMTACGKAQDKGSNEQYSVGSYDGAGGHIVSHDEMDEMLNLNKNAQLSDLVSIDISQFDDKYKITDEILEKLNIGIWSPIINKNGLACYYCDDLYGIYAIEDYTMENGVATITAYDSSSAYMTVQRGWEDTDPVKYDLPKETYRKLYDIAYENCDKEICGNFDGGETKYKFVLGNMSKEAVYNYFIDEDTVLQEDNLKDIIVLEVETANDTIIVPIITQTEPGGKFEWITEAVEYISELK